MENRSTNHKGIRFEPLETRRMFAGGALDASFSLDGKASAIFDGVQGNANDVAVQADGKTVVVGELFSGARTQFAVARFNLDGSLDTTFGPGGTGKVITNVGGKNFDQAKAVTIQPDGKILVAGTARSVRGSFSSDMAVVRYLPDGSLDRSFDGDGVLRIRVKDDSSAEDVVLQRDGKIVVAGSDLNGGLFSLNHDFAVARLNPNGSFDNSFSGDGRVIVPFGDSEFARAVAIDNTGTRATNPHFGKIILAGERTNFEGRNELAMARLTANGTIDTTFEGDGMLVGKFGNYSKAFVRGLLIQPNGRYVIAGHAVGGNAHGETPITLARYRPSGRIDRSFGTDGVAYINFGGTDNGSDVIQSTDGGLIVAGTSNNRFALAGLSANGTLNLSFGTGGKVITDFGAKQFAFDVGLAKAAGTRFVVTGGTSFNTARYLENGGPLITVTSTDAESTEGTGNNATFTVSRSQSLTTPTRVFFTIGGNAHRPNTLFSLNDPIDYRLTGMSVPFAGTPFVDIPANQTSVTVTLRPNNDTVQEGTEHAVFSVLSNPGYDIGTPGAVTISIADKDHVIFSGKLPGGPGITRASSMASLATQMRDLFSDKQIVEVI
jgi:uncharacterized delta-60 repeat protein